MPLTLGLRWGLLVAIAAVAAVGASLVGQRLAFDGAAGHVLLGWSVPRTVAAGERYAHFVGVSTEAGTVRAVVRVCDETACRQLPVRNFEGDGQLWRQLPAFTLEPGSHVMTLFVQVPWIGDIYRTVSVEEVEVDSLP